MLIFLKGPINFILLYIVLLFKNHTRECQKRPYKETHSNFLLKKETFQLKKRDLKETQKVV